MRGRSLFLDRARLACITCHRIEGTGAQIGPELTNLYQTMPLDKFIESIVEPSREIKEGFQMYSLILKNGDINNAFKVSSDAKQTVVRDLTGKLFAYPAEQIRSFDADKTSIMPEDAVAGISPGEFADLLKFLLDGNAQKTLRTTLTHAMAAGPLDPSLDSALPADPDAVAATQPGKQLWQPVDCEPNGKIKLPKISGGKDSAALLTSIQTPKEQQANLAINGNGNVKVLLNGTTAYEGPASDAPVNLSLKNGSNRLVIRMDASAATGVEIKLVDAVDASFDNTPR